MAHSERLIEELEAMRTNLAKHCLTEFATSNQGHAGGTMSILELVTALYFHHLKFDPENVDWPERGSRSSSPRRTPAKPSTRLLLSLASIRPRC